MMKITKKANPENDNISEDSKYSLQWVKRVLGILGILLTIVFFITSTCYLFSTDEMIQFHEVFMINNNPDINLFLSYSTKNEFIVGQPVNIESYMVFRNEQLYDDFIKNNIFHILVLGAKSNINDSNWYKSSSFTISETNEPLRKEIQSKENLYPITMYLDKHLEGNAEFVFDQSGTHDVSAVLYNKTNGAGTRMPLSKINIQPRTIGYEIKNNRYNILIGLITIMLAFVSFFLNMIDKKYDC